MKVLFLYPNMHGMNMLPSAIALLSSLLKQENHTVKLFDSTAWVMPGEKDFDSDKEKERNLNVRPFDDSKLSQDRKSSDVFSDFENTVRSFNPDLIAVSASEDIFPIGIQLLKQVRKFKIPTIVGGVLPTFAPELCLAYEEIDMICVGEGERALVELCDRMERGKNYTEIQNLWIKSNGEIRKNPLGPPTNIDENPLLDVSLFEESRLYRPMQGKVWKMLPVETHRGCPYTCSYCCSPSQAKLYRDQTGAKHFRKKSIESIRRQLVYFKEVIKAEAFYFWADTFLAYTPKEFDQFVEMYSEIKLPFWCQAFPDLIREDRIRNLMEVGLFRIGTGVEHGNEEFRTKVLKRKVSNRTMIERFKILNKYGLPFSVNNIMGFPTETRELVFDTIEFNRHLDADSMNAYSFSPFHGTPLRQMAEQLGFIEKGTFARSITKPTLLNMPQFPPEAIEGLRRCFVLYVKMPKSRWKEIEKAEALTPAGDRIWAALRDECAAHYMNF